MKLRNNKNKISIIVLSFVILIGAVLVFAFKPIGQDSSLLKENYTIIRTWEMPIVLNEISGIAWIGNRKLACVQDEEIY